jgi:hypothetical protein
LVSWIIRGKRGVFLDGLKGPGKSWWTSREAIARFLAALSARAAGQVIPVEPSRLDRDRQRRAKAAMDAMERDRQREREERRRAREMAG